MKKYPPRMQTQLRYFIYFYLCCSVMAIPNTMIYFTLYDQLKVMYGFEDGQKNVWPPMFAGITARSKIFSEQLVSANSGQ